MAKEALPHSTDCEETVLGTMLIDSKDCLDGITDLNEMDFYSENTNHRAVFRAIKQLNEKNSPIDIHTVADYLARTNVLESIGGVDYLISLTKNVVSFVNFDYYVKLLKEYTMMRNLIDVTEKIKEKANKIPSDQFSNFVSQAESEITRVTAERKVEGFVRSDVIASNLNTKLEEMRKGGITFGGVTTGFSYLDSIINGLQKGSLIVLAASTGVGKTALGLNLAFNAAKASKKPVGIFSLEMTTEENMKRLFANRATVSFEKISRVEFSKDEALRIQEAEREISEVPIYIDDTPLIQINELINKARKLKNDLGDLSLIVIDYLGLIQSEGRVDNEVTAIGKITSRLKVLAKELSVPILLLAQVNRRVEDREDAKPELSNLKGASAIEQDADQVLFIYNPAQAVSNRKKSFEDNFKKTDGDGLPEAKVVKNEKNPDEGEAVEVMVKKNRNGPLKNCFLLFFKTYQRFDQPSIDVVNELIKTYK